LIREWLVPITETAGGVIDTMALVLIVIGTVEAFVAAIRGRRDPRDRSRGRRRVRRTGEIAA
jgi:hypothetical protein